MRTWMKWVIAAVVVAVLAVVGAPFVYINFIKEDAPERFALDETPAVSGATAATTSTVAAADTGPSAGTVVVASAPPVVADGSVDGAWIVAPGSAVGYRVVEVLFGQDTEGVGRSAQVTGELTLSGTQVTAGSFTVDMTTVVSDEDRRDRQFNGRLLDTATFPTATFALTSPIELSVVPADGTAITATASGDLTLRGVTRPVTFEVQAQKSGDTIQVVGSTDIEFADYGIPQPDAPGITTQDHGLLEFDLRLAPV